MFSFSVYHSENLLFVMAVYKCYGSINVRSLGQYYSISYPILPLLEYHGSNSTKSVSQSSSLWFEAAFVNQAVMCSQSALFEVSARWWWPQLPGDLHSPLQIQYRTSSGAEKLCILWVGLNFTTAETCCIYICAWARMLEHLQ